MEGKQSSVRKPLASVFKIVPKFCTKSREVTFLKPGMNNYVFNEVDIMSTKSRLGSRVFQNVPVGIRINDLQCLVVNLLLEEVGSDVWQGQNCSDMFLKVKVLHGFFDKLHIFLKLADCVPHLFLYCAAVGGGLNARYLKKKGKDGSRHFVDIV